MPTPDEQPLDPIGDAVAQALAEVLFGATVSVTHAPSSSEAADAAVKEGSASATGQGPEGWATTITIGLTPRVGRLLQGGPTALEELLGVLPGAGLRAAAQLRGTVDGRRRPTSTLRRAVRDTLAVEVLAVYFRSRLGDASPAGLVEEMLDYLIELSGTRVEAHDLTHGVAPAPSCSTIVSTASAGPASPRATEGWLDSGSLVALATRALGGLGFYVRGDRSIWTFVDGQPLLVRRGEHWTTFPVELAVAISNMIGGGPAAEVVAHAAYMISARPQGAILAIVDDPLSLDGMVSPKDRYDLRDGIDPTAMRPETRLHHLIDAEVLDERTVARLAALDGATVLDRAGRLIAYAAIVTTADSEHEGAHVGGADAVAEGLGGAEGLRRR